VPQKHLLRTKHQSDDARYAVSANLIFPINYRSAIPYLAKSIVTKGREFSFHALKFIGIGNHNRVLSNKSMFEFRCDQSKG
jgi:hypothetical protein